MKSEELAMRGGGPNEMLRIIRSLLTANFDISAVKDNFHSLGKDYRVLVSFKTHVKIVYSSVG